MSHRQYAYDSPPPQAASHHDNARFGGDKPASLRIENTALLLRMIAAGEAPMRRAELAEIAEELRRAVPAVRTMEVEAQRRGRAPA